MKITKTLAGVFLAAFLIGLVFVPTAKNEAAERKPTTNTVSDPKPTPPFVTRTQDEVIEENDEWENEDESKFEIKLLEAGGVFHGDEVKARSGETWLGLFEENGKYFLRDTKIKILREYDIIVDGEDTTRKTGKTVLVDNKKEPIILLKRAKMLREGEIYTVFFGNPYAEENTNDQSMKRGFNQEFLFGERKYVLRVKEGINKTGEKILSLVLDGDGKTQTLHSLKTFEEGDYLGVLYWIGDLDRDGKIDILTELYIHDNVIYRNLYLSTPAEKSKIVKKVAVFSTTGC